MRRFGQHRTVPLYAYWAPVQVLWCRSVEEQLERADSCDLALVEHETHGALALLADTVLMQHLPIRRKKIEHMITGKETSVFRSFFVN